MQGLIYLENCITCRLNNVENDDPTCTVCINLYPQEAHLFNNTYFNNYEGLIMYSKQ